jgi:tripartite-type tricarboxylate transporter receptor subunit TctC
MKPNRWIAVIALITAGISQSFAQAYPAKPVRLVVPYPAAGVAEVMSRLAAERIAAQWGQPVIIEPRPGGNGVIGTEAVLAAPADGYTWLGVSSGHAAIGGLNPKLRWNPATDFVAAGLFAQSSSYFVVPAVLAARDLKEFVALARSQPGQHNFGHPGVGLTPYLSMENFKRVTGVALQDVPYKGNPQIMADLIPGRISAAVLSSASIIGPARGGQVKVLAVMNARRTKSFPDVPTVAEAGFPEATVSPTWFGIVMRTGTPTEIVKRAASEVEKAAKSPELMAQLEKLGAEPAHLGAEEFDAVIRRDMNTWARVIKESGMKLEN